MGDTCGLCKDGCRDLERPLQGIGLPDGPWLHWSCEQYANALDVGHGHCDDDTISRSHLCSSTPSCQIDPGYIRTRCPATCGMCQSQCKDAEEFKYYAFALGFSCLFACTFCCGVHHFTDPGSANRARWLAVIVICCCIAVFRFILSPAATACDISTQIFVGGALGDVAG